MINLNILTLRNPKSVEAKTHAYVEPEFHPSSLHQYLAHNVVSLCCCHSVLETISRKVASQQNILTLFS